MGILGAILSRRASKSRRRVMAISRSRVVREARNTLEMIGMEGLISPEDVSGLFASNWVRRRRSRKSLRAAYDAAVTNEANARHWANADGLSADMSTSPEVRRRLRMRARYEAGSNSYCKGILLTLANDCVGTGVRLQLLTDRPELNRALEAEFQAWQRAINLAAKLRTMRMARATDGEAFALLTTNPRNPHPVTLDVRLIEADQIATPWAPMPGDRAVDGIELDEWGNPDSYHMLKYHPGSGLGSTEYTSVDARKMLHWYRVDRPGQHRGIPELTPALPLFAQLRRYTLAVLGAAETAAGWAAVLYTDAPPNGDTEDLDPLDSIELNERELLTLPAGWKVGQIDAKQPVTTYGEFKEQVLNEIARCILMPRNVAQGDSSNYNYASGRLDHQTYHTAIDVDRSAMEIDVLDRVLVEFLREARLVPGSAAQKLPADLMSIPHTWYWPGHEHVDPQKEANAQATRLASNTTTLAVEYARQGLDWEDQLRQRAKEKELERELGLTSTPAPPAPTDDDEDEETPAGKSRRAA